MFPRWLSWLIIAFLAYVIILGNRQAPEPLPQPAPESASVVPDTESYPALHALIDGERWVRGINPEYRSVEDACAMPARDTAAIAVPTAVILNEGEGEAASCGTSIAVAVTQQDMRNRAKKLPDVTLTLGEQPGLDGLLLGMRPNELRQLTLQVAPEGYATLPGLTGGHWTVLQVRRIATP